MTSMPFFQNDQGPFEILRITNFTYWLPTLSALEEVYIVEKYVIVTRLDNTN